MSVVRFTMKHTISASEFEERCLEVFDEVAATGREIIITKDRKPVAKVMPIEPPKSLKPNDRKNNRG
jgi:prevent-host-death family protein